MCLWLCRNLYLLDSHIQNVPNIENITKRGTDETVFTPRTGPLGYWDRLVGPTATVIEQSLTVAFATLATVGVCGYAVVSGIGWSWLQLAVVAVLIFDIAGGITANATASGRRWWHRPGRTNRDHFLFVALHIHPFVLAGLFAGVTPTEAAIIYGYLLIAAAIVLRVDPSIAHATALALFALWLLVSSSFPMMPIGLGWFVSLLYLKLLVSHLGGEEYDCTDGRLIDMEQFE